jgi:soluble lytic murein transglycosylase-like protein
MADLTNSSAQIANVDRGAITMRDEKSVGELVLGGVEKGFQALSAKRYNDNLDMQADKNDALNNLATSLQGIDINQNNNVVPNGVRQGITTLNNTQRAVDQGVLPGPAYATQLQNVTSSLMAKYPDAAHAIATEMRANGHDHPMFQNIFDAQQQHDSERNAWLAGRNTAAAAYIQNGGVPTASFEDQVTAGQGILKAQADQRASAEKATAAVQLGNLTAAESKAKKEEAVIQGIQGINAEVDARTTPIYQTVNSLYSQANGDPVKLAKLQTEILPMISNMVSAAKTSAYKHANSLGIVKGDDLKAIDAHLDTLGNSLNAIFSGPASQYQAMQRSVANLKNQYQLDVAKSAPLLYKFGSVIGFNNAAALFDSTTALDPKVQDQLRRELNGISDTTDGQTHFANVVQILQGNKNLHEFTQAEARSLLGGVVTGKNSSEAAIINGGSATDANVYKNSLGNILNATNALNTASDASDFVQAGKLVATQRSRQAIDAMAKDPSLAENAQALGMASHTTGLKMVQSMVDMKENKARVGLSDYQTIQYNRNAGVFEIKTDIAAARAHAVEVSARNPMGARVDPNVFSGTTTEAKQFLDTLNNSLDHTTKTGKWDLNLPKGLTPLEMRNHYATGTPFKTEQKATSADSLWDTSEQKLSDKLRSLPNQFITEDAVRDNSEMHDQQANNQAPTPEVANASIDKIDQYAGQFKPASISGEEFKQLARAVAYQESRLNPDAVSQTGVKGVMQLTKGTAAMYKLNRDNPDENIQGGIRHLAHLVDAHHGDIKGALMEYNGGSDPVYDRNVLRWVGKVNKAKTS